MYAREGRVPEPNIAAERVNCTILTESSFSFLPTQFPPEESWHWLVSLQPQSPDLSPLRVTELHRICRSGWQDRAGQSRTGTREPGLARDKSWVILAGGLSQSLLTSQTSPSPARMIKTWVSVICLATSQSAPQWRSMSLPIFYLHSFWSALNHTIILEWG